MRFFPNAPIRWKQMLIIMLTTSVALVLASGAFIAYGIYTFRTQTCKNLLSISDRIADRAVGFAAGGDKPSANAELKGVLTEQTHIVKALVYKEGKIIAAYRRDDQTGYFTPPPLPANAGFTFSADDLVLVKDIGGEKPMIIYLESDLEELHGQILRYVGIVVGVLLFAGAVAFLISSKLQGVISQPIVHVAGVARIVSNKKNYAVRAVRPEGNDELVSLIDGFNEMLAQIQARDGELQKARDELEKRVEERTRDLLSQIAERSRAEKALQQQFARISLLNQITHSISERLDLRSVLNIVLKQLEDHLPIDFGSVFVTNNAGDFLIMAVRSARPLPPEAAFRLAPNSVVTATQAGLIDCTNGQTVFAPDTSALSAPLMHLLHHSDLKSAVAVPMLLEEKLFGVLLVARRTTDAFSSGECEFLRVLSEQVALAAHQARLHMELQEAYNELRQTQQAVMQQQRLQALGQMASGIAHDINNALSPIIVYSELILRNDKILTETMRRHLNNIKVAGEDIAQIVSRMREFYRRREGTEQLTSINLTKLVEQVIELTRPRWRDIPQQKGVVVDMETDIAMGEAPEVVGSASELREALTNLILNSVDAMPSGGKLTVRTRYAAASADQKLPAHAVVEVIDTGVGMDEETRKRCLEPFFSTKGQRGTGLGLAMVYGIMERHEGAIEVESIVGKGTTMRLILPIRDESEVDDGSSFVFQGPIKPLQILCIDDEPLLRQMLREILETDGHTVALADGGQSGLEAFRSRKGLGTTFDVVITDLGMPYVDGRQVACALKKESPNTPVVLLTGWGAMLKADGDVPVHVDAVISKPPRINELRETLVRVTKSE
jgi:signal transduction histidine kinase/ActR/RegA family two-component response regulator